MTSNEMPSSPSSVEVLIDKVVQYIRNYLLIYTSEDADNHPLNAAQGRLAQELMSDFEKYELLNQSYRLMIEEQWYFFRLDLVQHNERKGVKIEAGPLYEHEMNLLELQEVMNELQKKLESPS